MKHGGNVWDEARPEDWLDYSANLRPEGTPAWVTEVMQRAVADTRYYPDRRMRAARQGLAAALGVEEACILPTAGGAQAIDLALSLDRGASCSSRLPSANTQSGRRCGAAALMPGRQHGRRIRQCCATPITPPGRRGRRRRC